MSAKMQRLVISLALLASVSCHEFFSAATPAQIKFAEENKYDDTGPGAKTKEFAYRTYKNIDDALVAYLDDPDTKLPEEDRAKALNLLYINNPYKSASLYSQKPGLFKPSLFGQKPDLFGQKPYSLLTNDVQDRPAFTSYDSRLRPESFSLGASVKPQRPEDKPLYVYSYGIMPTPGQSQSAQASRQDGVSHGYYSHLADGRHHVVQYFDDRRQH